MDLFSVKRNRKQVSAFVIAGFFLLFACSCHKHKEPPPPLETGTVTDLEGHVYHTIKIGNQWWMSENLKSTKYRDSSSIRKIQTDTSEWNNDTTGAYCKYDDNPNSPGLLYNWYAVNNSKKIAPAGWHIPTDDKWKELEKYLGMNQSEADKTNFRGTFEGDKLKEKGPENWNLYGDVWATNESGFSALAGNCRLFDGEWGFPYDLASTGFWWTSTDHTADNEAWYRYLDYKKSNVFRYHGSKTYGFSIRCVKD